MTMFSARIVRAGGRGESPSHQLRLGSPTCRCHSWARQGLFPACLVLSPCTVATFLHIIHFPQRCYVFSSFPKWRLFFKVSRLPAGRGAQPGDKGDNASRFKCVIAAKSNEEGAAPECKGWEKREIPEKTHRSTASSGTIPTCESPVTRPGIEPGSPWWEASVLVAPPPRPLLQIVLFHLFQPTSRGAVGWCATDLGVSEVLGSNPGLQFNAPAHETQTRPASKNGIRNRSSIKTCMPRWNASIRSHLYGWLCGIFGHLPAVFVIERVNTNTPHPMNVLLTAGCLPSPPTLQPPVSCRPPAAGMTHPYEGLTVQQQLTCCREGRYNLPVTDISHLTATNSCWYDSPLRGADSPAAIDVLQGTAGMTHPYEGLTVQQQLTCCREGRYNVPVTDISHLTATNSCWYDSPLRGSDSPAAVDVLQGRKIQVQQQLTCCREGRYNVPVTDISHLTATNSCWYDSPLRGADSPAAVDVLQGTAGMTHPYEGLTVQQQLTCCREGRYKVPVTDISHLTATNSCWYDSPLRGADSPAAVDVLQGTAGMTHPYEGLTVQQQLTCCREGRYNVPVTDISHLTATNSCWYDSPLRGADSPAAVDVLQEGRYNGLTVQQQLTCCREVRYNVPVTDISHLTATNSCWYDSPLRGSDSPAAVDVLQGRKIQGEGRYNVPVTDISHLTATNSCWYDSPLRGADSPAAVDVLQGTAGMTHPYEGLTVQQQLTCCREGRYKVPVTDIYTLTATNSCWEGRYNVPITDISQLTATNSCWYDSPLRGADSPAAVDVLQGTAGMTHPYEGLTVQQQLTCCREGRYNVPVTDISHLTATNSCWYDSPLRGADSPAAVDVLQGTAGMTHPYEGLTVQQQLTCCREGRYKVPVTDISHLTATNSCWYDSPLRGADSPAAVDVLQGRKIQLQQQLTCCREVRYNVPVTDISHLTATNSCWYDSPLRGADSPAAVDVLQGSKIQLPVTDISHLTATNSCWYDSPLRGADSPAAVDVLQGNTTVPVTDISHLTATNSCWYDSPLRGADSPAAVDVLQEGRYNVPVTDISHLTATNSCWYDSPLRGADSPAAVDVLQGRKKIQVPVTDISHLTRPTAAGMTHLTRADSPAAVDVLQGRKIQRTFTDIHTDGDNSCWYDSPLRGLTVQQQLTADSPAAVDVLQEVRYNVPVTDISHLTATNSCWYDSPLRGSDSPAAVDVLQGRKIQAAVDVLQGRKIQLPVTDISHLTRPTAAGMTHPYEGLTVQQQLTWKKIQLPVTDISHLTATNSCWYDSPLRGLTVQQQLTADSPAAVDVLQGRRYNVPVTDISHLTRPTAAGMTHPYEGLTVQQQADSPAAVDVLQEGRYNVPVTDISHLTATNSCWYDHPYEGLTVQQQLTCWQGRKIQRQCSSGRCLLSWGHWNEKATEDGHVRPSTSAILISHRREATNNKKARARAWAVATRLVPETKREVCDRPKEPQMEVNDPHFRPATHLRARVLPVSPGKSARLKALTQLKTLTFHFVCFPRCCFLWSSTQWNCQSTSSAATLQQHGGITHQVTCGDLLLDHVQHWRCIPVRGQDSTFINSNMMVLHTRLHFHQQQHDGITHQVTCGDLLLDHVQHWRCIPVRGQDSTFINSNMTVLHTRLHFHQQQYDGITHQVTCGDLLLDHVQYWRCIPVRGQDSTFINSNMTVLHTS
ncbi:hypothetical protein PR048_030897 [Dryococelus australis]|uniref:Uncharacterized protein n=1 Tax=Dryococelus australis TaxID=614101 RepID=A0ABQ9GCU4_9NEOP|nr:hypothetical protein PR048_030897 [Dryococelus australis]